LYCERRNHSKKLAIRTSFYRILSYFCIFCLHRDGVATVEESTKDLLDRAREEFINATARDYVRTFLRFFELFDGVVIFYARSAVHSL
jgi:hypothetical protein